MNNEKDVMDLGGENWLEECCCRGGWIWAIADITLADLEEESETSDHN